MLGENIETMLEDYRAMNTFTVEVICKATDEMVASVPCDEESLSWVMTDLRNNYPGCRVFYRGNS